MSVRENTNEFSASIYINGIKRNITSIDSTFYADSDEMPNVRCSFHDVGYIGASYLNSGGSVYTSGTWYSAGPTSVEKLNEQKQSGKPSKRMV